MQKRQQGRTQIAFPVHYSTLQIPNTPINSRKSLPNQNSPGSRKPSFSRLNQNCSPTILKILLLPPQIYQSRCALFRLFCPINKIFTSACILGPKLKPCSYTVEGSLLAILLAVKKYYLTEHRPSENILMLSARLKVPNRSLWK